MNGKPDVVFSLMDHGADVDIVDNTGKDAIVHARDRNFTGVVRRLCQLRSGFYGDQVPQTGKVWLMGGIVDGESSTTVLTYDADADTWEMAPPLPFPVAGGSATTMDGGIVLRCLSRGVQHLLQYRDARWSEIEQEVPFKTASGFGSVLLG